MQRFRFILPCLQDWAATTEELDSLGATAASTQISAAAEVSTMLRIVYICHSASTLQPPDMSAEAG